MGNQHYISYRNKYKYSLPFNQNLNSEIENSIKKRGALTPNKDLLSKISSNDCISSHSALTTYKIKKTKKNLKKKIKITNIENLIIQIYNENIKENKFSLFSCVFNCEIYNRKNNTNSNNNLDNSSSLKIPFDILPINKNDITESLFMSPEEINYFNEIYKTKNNNNKEIKKRKSQKNPMIPNHIANINSVNINIKYISNKNNTNLLKEEDFQNIKEIKRDSQNDSNKTYKEIIDALNNVENRKINNKDNINNIKNLNKIPVFTIQTCGKNFKVTKGELYKKKRPSKGFRLPKMDCSTNELITFTPTFTS